MKADWLTSRSGLLVATGIFLLTLSAEAQSVYYVRSGATGACDGSDWNNAYVVLPSTLQRGATYYVAAGNYPSHGFSDAPNGTQVITVKKAWAADHGTDTGWQASYGAGQAMFTAPLFFNSSYYVIDGQYRSNCISGYGFHVSNATNAKPINGNVQIGMDQGDHGTDIRIQYVDIEGSHVRNNSIIGDVGVYIAGKPASDRVTIQNCFIHDVGASPFFVRAAGFTLIQSNYISRNCSSPAHAEGISASAGVNNLTLRFNIWADIEGTAAIATACGCGFTTGNTISNWWIYGNVFCYTTNNPSRPNPNWGLTDGVLSVFDVRCYGDFCFYNNTMVNLNDAATGGSGVMRAGIAFGGAYPATAVKWYIKNNLWVNSPGAVQWHVMTAGADIQDFQWDHNTYIHSGDPGDTDPASVTGVGSPLLNWQGGNFHLAAPTTAGVTLAPLFGTDPDGSVRGADGVWDRGAFEFRAR